MRAFFSIPYYHDYLSPDFARALLDRARAVDGIPGLVEVGQGGGLETPDALRFLVTLYERVEGSLAEVLRRRQEDRKFIDERTRACHAFNRDLGRDLLDPDYRTVLGLQDAKGRIVFGPKSRDYCRPVGKPIAPLPEFLKGPHVTLFGPPDSAKMAINAMNAYHRRLPGEPPVVTELLSASPVAPMWGADDEDSKTPLRQDLVDAAVNLTGCFEGRLSLQEGDRRYELAGDHLSLPIKRFPGLALPSSFLFYRGNPIPLHLYDFALHLYRNWRDPRALVFYVPKLENEEEARYLHGMIATAEAMIRELHPEYTPGSVRLMVVLENPRAIVRAHEIMDELHPYFAGASLGWHDFLASTARLFKEDPNYRIPVKADPDIVIKYIKASHRLLADAVGFRGGIKVGGMYGILPLAGDRESMQIALRGFIKDVVTQLKRELTGFWVAHPDFVRLGLALVEAWKRRQAGDPSRLKLLVTSLLDERHAAGVMAFIDGPDVGDLDRDDPGYIRALIVADLKESDYIPNHHPDEIRYNVFQSLQYLTDWLRGNGCVALPTIVDGVPVRVMDDLATAERSRWEVWHELRHGRFSVEEFVQIAHEEMSFIRRDLSDGKKIVQVKWDETTAKWYPVAFRLMLQLMTDPDPVEFATELLMPFTVEEVRGSPDPWAAVQQLDPGKYGLEKHVADFDHYFEICGSQRFARAMALSVVEDPEAAREIVLGFSVEEIRTAASFHGDIGQARKTLDARAATEQARALDADAGAISELRRLGAEYLARFGFKFLVSAQGKTASELLEQLKLRLMNDPAREIQSAREALWEISRKRMGTSRRAKARIEEILARHGIPGASIAVNYEGQTQAISVGRLKPESRLQLASLSKPLASAFAIEYFRARGIPLSSSVDALLAQAGSSFRLGGEWGSRVTLENLMSHSALNMHYVNGIPAHRPMPSALELIRGNAELGYEPVRAIAEPGREFHYSGGGFLVLEHLIEALERKPVQPLIHSFLERLGLADLRFDHGPGEAGFMDSGKEAPRLKFPAFAAGAIGTSVDMAGFLLKLTRAYRELDGASGLSHDTAVQMLHGTDKGCREFMGCRMGLGIFTAEAGANRLAIHQGANEGFRALFIQCYDGPDRGKGFVILCNGDNRAVPAIGEIARELLELLRIGGLNLARLAENFDFSELPQEQIVNLGYKRLIFDAFEEDLPEEIVDRGPLDPLSSRNLAVGARIVQVSDQKFARAENLISPNEPVFDPELFGRQGKIMDSWETRRHNPTGRDWLELELKKPATIRFASLSTRFHDGNHPEFARVLGFSEGKWLELLPKTALQGHALLKVDLGARKAVFSRVRLEIFPDGGITRLGLFSELPAEAAASFNGKSERFHDPIPKTAKPLSIPYSPTADEIQKNLGAARKVDWASRAFGGRVERASNEHYGPAAQVISPFPAIHMFDGLESARSRVPGHHEEAVIRLGKPVKLDRLVLDFTYFVNNNPVEVSVDGRIGGEWVELSPRTNVKAFAGNQKALPLAASGPVDQLLIRTYPDGGINRIRVPGAPA